MKDICINSKDPWLLVRLETELQLCGFNSDEKWNSNQHPFDDSMGSYLCCNIMHIYDKRLTDMAIEYHNHSYAAEISIAITEKNYHQTLKTILNEAGIREDN